MFIRGLLVLTAKMLVTKLNIKAINHYLLYKISIEA